HDHPPIITNTSLQNREQPADNVVGPRASPTTECSDRPVSKEHRAADYGWKRHHNPIANGRMAEPGGVEMLAQPGEADDPDLAGGQVGKGRSRCHAQFML